jgi:L-iditol 2-dehydrogenase
MKIASRKMKAVVVRAPMQFDVEEVPLPEVPESGILLKVKACGLCGSDLRTLRSGHRKVTLPWIIGHEICGEVAEAGSSYDGPWKKGELLAVAPVVYCGRCEFCLAGKYELCTDYAEIAQKWPGGFAEYIAIPADSVQRGTIQTVPDGVDPALAAITEPVSSCVHAQEKASIGAGDTVAIIGAGPVGCMHTCLARARQASKLFLIDVAEERLKLAQAFAPDAVINATATNPVDRVRELTAGRGVDVVITATSAPVAAVQAVEMAAKGGRVLLFGGLPKNESKPGIDLNIVHYNALQLIGTTIFAPRHNRIALDLIAWGKIPADKIVTHRFALRDFRKGALMALDGKVLKAVFLP